jgi:hypothetical protein
MEDRSGPVRLDRRLARLVNQALNNTQSARRGHQDKQAHRPDKVLLEQLADLQPAAQRPAVAVDLTTAEPDKRATLRRRATQSLHRSLTRTMESGGYGERDERDSVR